MVEIKYYCDMCKSEIKMEKEAYYERIEIHYYEGKDNYFGVPVNKREKMFCKKCSGEIMKFIKTVKK